ncbi:MAG TPA: GGDEF domain-containing protein [Woeseiaceae bacterium]|nr:GGDEF domain-containing protein [Woeseiaceae bacterium]
MTRSQDDVELVNRTLRDAGHAAHCQWVSTPEKLDQALGGGVIELIVVNKDSYSDTLRQVVEQKDAYVPEVPVIAVSKKVDEASIQDAMKQGACDLVSLGNKARLQAVVTRELRAYRVEQALNSTISSATEYRKQLNDYMQGSSIPIAYAQEGIVTNVNNAWLDLFRIGDKGEVVGLPLMDMFEPESQAAIKGAIVATTKGKWQRDEKLQAKARLGQSQPSPLEMEFQLTDFEDGPHVQIRIAPPESKEEEPTKLVHEALKRDPTTLFFHRSQFLEKIAKRLDSKPKSGLHLLVYIKPDRFSELRNVIGILPTEEVLSQLAEEVRKKMHPRDVAGRFEGTVLMALLERGNERDGEVWAKRLVEHIRNFDFKVEGQSVNLTCTIGICAVSGVYSSLEELVAAVVDAHADGKKSGGNCAFLNESTDADTRLRKYDEIWVRYIKSALMENRFRLAQLPIAGLRSDSQQMYDLLVRMIDEQGNAVLPSDFLPAAERNNLMKAIDRWIITASMDFCAENGADRVFVRLSRQSLQDATLCDWMRQEFGKRKLEPSKICVQVPEQEAAKYIKQLKQVVEQFRTLGVAFALEHYGIDKNRFQILDILRPDYVKIDGELMHTLTTDTKMQENVRQVAEAAEERKIQTIAERVENANAMAVLFQLGVHYMQGHYVHEPEVVLQEPASVSQTTLDAIGSS